MIAFVLSGGANRGALQVGALQVLLEAGIVPDMVVGASVGAINGAYVAYDPSPEGGQKLGELWAQVTRDDLYPGNYLTAVWSMLCSKESLFANDRWYRFLQKNTPCVTFDEIQKAACYITATELTTGRPHLFGEDKSQCVLDAMMASCALPPFHPPYWIDGEAYIDGGATGNLPLRVALAKGATQIYALSIVTTPSERKALNFLDVSASAVDAILKRQIAVDLELCATRDDVSVRQIDLAYPGDLPPWDFSRTPEMVELGREAATLALADGPLRPRTLQHRLAEGAERLATSVSAAAATLSSQLWPKETAKSEIYVHRA